MVSSLLRGFTATHKTIIIVAALAAPGALYGAVTYQAVAIVDPLTGYKSLVDSGRRTYVYDPIAGYANNPLNFVKISGCDTVSTTFTSIYVVPAGKALIIKSIDMSYYHGIAGNDNYTYLYDQSTFIAGFDSTNTAGTQNTILGNGWYAKSGDNIYYDGDNGATSSASPLLDTCMSIEGYLVPEGATPADAAEATPQTVRFGSSRKK